MLRLYYFLWFQKKNRIVVKSLISSYTFFIFIIFSIQITTSPGYRSGDMFRLVIIPIGYIYEQETVKNNKNNRRKKVLAKKIIYQAPLYSRKHTSNFVYRCLSLHIPYYPDSLILFNTSWFSSM